MRLPRECSVRHAIQNCGKLMKFSSNSLMSAAGVKRFARQKLACFSATRIKLCPIRTSAAKVRRAAGCRQCGGCMVGCRYNAKNTLPKNYLYFAEKNGAEVISEAEVVGIKSLADNAGYGVEFKSSTRFLTDTGSGSKPEA